MSKLAILAALSLAFVPGCKKQETEKQTPPAPTPAPAGKAPASAPHGGGHAGQGGTVHGGGGPAGGAARTPAAKSPGPGPVDLGGLKVTIPKDWVGEVPKSSMRKAQYAIGEGADRVEVVVFTFGKQAGGVEANLERWTKQFSKVDGKPKTETKTVGQMKVTVLDVSGTFGGGPAMRPNAPKSEPQAGTRMVAAIVEAPAGAYYFKMLGPVPGVEKAKDGFDDMIDSSKP